MMGKQSKSVLFHDALAAGWELRYQKNSFKERMRSFLSILDELDVHEQKWLDAGCGAGVLSRALAAKGCAVTGVDASAKMIQAARSSKAGDPAASINEPVFEVIETVENLDFPLSSFDGVVCSSVLEYVENPHRAIAEFHRIVKPGGFLLVSVPNKTSLLRNVQRTSYLVLKTFFGVRWPAYLEFSKHSFTYNSFCRLLKSRGFTVLASTHLSPYMPAHIVSPALSASLIIFLAQKEVADSQSTDAT